MKIKTMFDIIQGHQITDEELYKNMGNILVYTGKNDIKGYWNNQIVEEKDLPCVTYPTKANSGEAYVKTEIFDANNTAIMIPFPEWREKINLEWLSYKLPSIFLQIQTSKEGVSYLNKEIVEEYDFDMPDINIQLNELKYYKKLNNLKIKLEKIKMIIDKIKQQSIILSVQPTEEIVLSQLLDYTSRNDSLSEEGIYKRSQNLDKAKKKIKVISGSIEDFYGYIPIEENIHFVEERPCLQVITRGNAGQLRFLPKDNYATNTNSMLLTIKTDKKELLNVKKLEQEETYLKFLEVYLIPFFAEYCSSADLSVFPLTEVLDKISIPLFKYSVPVEEIVTKFDKIKQYELKVNFVLNEIKNIFSKEVITKKMIVEAKI